jgi:hypothetical protein
MTQKTIFILFIVISILNFGCGGSSTESANTETVSNTDLTSNPAAVNVNANNVQVITPGTNSNVNGIPNMPVDNNSAIYKEDPTKGVKPQPMTSPAPDNSEVTVNLGENLVETRTFKNNAQIAKIERIVVPSKNNEATVKVYLRNGQVKEITNPKIDVMKAPSNEILQLVSGKPMTMPTTANTNTAPTPIPKVEPKEPKNKPKPVSNANADTQKTEPTPAN